MRTLLLFAFALLTTACKLEPMGQPNELKNKLDAGSGKISTTVTSMPTTATLMTGNFYLYTIDPTEMIITGRFSVMINGSRVDYIGDFYFSSSDDFNEFEQNQALFMNGNTAPLTIKVKLISKGSSCKGSPDSEYCATVITPDSYEITELQSIE